MITVAQLILDLQKLVREQPAVAAMNVLLVLDAKGNNFRPLAGRDGEIDWTPGQRLPGDDFTDEVPPDECDSLVLWPE